MRMTKSLIYPLFAMVALLLGSCSENLDEDNDPAIQAQLNGDFYSATQFSAVNNDDGSVSITGVAPAGTVVLNLESAASGIYFLGPGSDTNASFSVDELTTFSTDNGSGRGEISVFRTDAPNTVSAEFSFIAYTASENDSLFMRQGIAYQVPFGGAVVIPTPTPVTESFTAMVDGMPFDATAVTTVISSGELLITGSQGSAFINIRVAEDIMPGVYMVDAMPSEVTVQYGNAGSTVAGGVTGMVEILTNETTNQVMVGTFEFLTGPPDDFEITAGSFTVNY